MAKKKEIIVRSKHRAPRFLSDCGDHPSLFPQGEIQVFRTNGEPAKSNGGSGTRLMERIFRIYGANSATLNVRYIVKSDGDMVRQQSPKSYVSYTGAHQGMLTKIRERLRGLDIDIIDPSYTHNKL